MRKGLKIISITIDNFFRNKFHYFKIHKSRLFNCKKKKKKKLISHFIKKRLKSDFCFKNSRQETINYFRCNQIFGTFGVDVVLEGNRIAEYQSVAG